MKDTLAYTWHEVKRHANIKKHGLDFLDVDYVLESPYCLNVKTIRNGELRLQSFAYVFDCLTVLTIVYLPNETPHIISFRPAKRSEREVYHEWLELEFNKNDA
jgi:uncharacterized DUF497 family protein